MSIYGNFKNNHSLEKLGTEPILSDVHQMAIRISRNSVSNGL